MAAVHPSITESLRNWIDAQPMFFVATAPLDTDGHVNVSPKGRDSLRVVDAGTVRYLDLTGSGAETAAHLAENGRITVMFCAFEDPPRILRLFGWGETFVRGSDGYDRRVGDFPDVPRSARAIVEVAVTRVQTSCGFGVPLMDLVSQRDRLVEWGDAKTDEGLADYWATKNATSIDGLPSISYSSVNG